MAGASKPGDMSTRRQRIAELAKQSPQRGFTSLAHLIDIDWLYEAYRRTRRDGAPGVDGQTAQDYEADLAGNLQALLDRAQSGTYRAPPVRRARIPKPGSPTETRPLGLPTFEDKVLQRAVALVLEAVYEQDFLDCSFGFRPGRSAHQALEALRQQTMQMGGGWIVEVDIRKFFDTLDHAHLRDLLQLRVRDGVLLRLIGKWLNAGVLEDGDLSSPEAGTPQGGVISPLLSNIYLHALDRAFADGTHGRLVRYADDFVVMCRSRAQAEAARGLAGRLLAELGLELHPGKTKVVDLTYGREGLDFLGCHFRARVSGRLLERGVRRCYLQRWPSQAAMKRVRQKLKAKTGRGRAGEDIREVIADLNPILRGWGNYFRTGNAAQKFVHIDRYAERRLRGLMRKRYGRHLRPGQSATWTREWFEAHGLYRLRGTIRYPAPAS